MSVTYLICFILLGIAGIANLIALVILSITLINRYSIHMRKSNFLNGMYSISICKFKTNINNNAVSMDNRESREHNKTVNN